MYKITVNASGKYHNVVLGVRYCLTRKPAIKLINLFLEVDCDVTVEKFIRCGYGFAWSNSTDATKIVFDEDNEGKSIARKARRDDY